MRRHIGGTLLSALVFASLTNVGAQEQSATAPPKVLTIMREFVKPGKQGTEHEKTESAFVQAFARAKWPTHYLAASSLSGKSRVLFLTGYDSFAAWEKDNQGIEKNAALSQALDRATAADGELLSEFDAGTFVYRPDQSLRAPVDIPHMRYFEMGIYRVKQGHEKDWEEGVKLVTAAYEKIPGVHWATFQGVYGASENTYLIFTPRKSLAEVDADFAQMKQFEAAMGEDGMKRLRELSAAAIDSSENQLFQFSPKMSYVPDEWTKADPDFWKPKAATATPNKAEKKPEGKQ